MRPGFSGGAGRSGEVVLIAGAAGGLGAAVAQRLAARGAVLVLVDPDLSHLTDLAAKLNAAGSPVYALCADIREDAAIDELVDHVENEIGPIDVFISSAELRTNAAFRTVTTQEIDSQIGLHLRSPIMLARKVLPGMLSRDRGHIVLVSATTADIQLPDKATYAAAKAGSIAFCRSLRRELAKTDVAVSVLTPRIVPRHGTSIAVRQFLGNATTDEVANEVVKVLDRRAGVGVQQRLRLQQDALREAAHVGSLAESDP